MRELQNTFLCKGDASGLIEIEFRYPLGPEPGDFLKLFIEGDLTIGTDTIEDQIQHVDLFCCPIRISLGTNIIPESPGGDLGNL